MTKAFVWFHNSSADAPAATAFYEQLLGWHAAPGPAGLTLLSGAEGPLAAIAATDGERGWIPFAQVSDVDAATNAATRLGATVLKEKSRGPAGEFTIVRDPGGAAVALWQQA